MLLQRRPLGACKPSVAPSTAARVAPGIAISRSQLRITANWNPLGGKGGGGNKDKEDAARRALEQSFGKKKQPGPEAGKKQAAKPVEPAKPAASTPPKNPLQNMFGGAGGSGGGFGGGGGGGGGGDGGGGFFSGGGADQGGEKPIQDELLELMRGTWVLLSNLALFLVFSSFLHRSLMWFVQTELLVAVGAPQQAGERVVGKLFEAVEWVERHVLGWSLPGDEEEELASSKVVEVLQNYTPEQAAYTFAQLKYNKSLSEEDRRTLHRAYALRYYERADGKADDVDPAAVQSIKDRLDPSEADRRAYLRAKAQGNLAAYWAQPGRREAWEKLMGAPPPATA